MVSVASSRYSSSDSQKLPSTRRAPPQVVQSTPPMEEIKPVEEDVQHVVSSEAGPEQEKIVLEPKPEEVKEPQKQQIAAVHGGAGHGHAFAIEGVYRHPGSVGAAAEIGPHDEELRQGPRDGGRGDARRR